jgi:hypothetical protein
MTQGILAPAGWIHPDAAEPHTTIYTPPFRWQTLFLVTILAGVGVGIAASKTEVFPGEVSAAQWGWITGGGTFLVGCVLRRVLRRRQELGRAAAEQPFVKATTFEELVAGAARESAQELLNGRRIQAGQIVDGSVNGMIAFETAKKVIQASRVTPCGRAIAWEDSRMSAMDPVAAGQNRYAREGFNDGIQPVYPLTLRQLSAEERAADARLARLGEILRRRYFGTFQLGVTVEGQVVRLVREDGLPCHTVELMEQIYAQTAQELAEMQRISEEEQIEEWFMEALHAMAALHLLQEAQIEGNRLIIRGLRYDFDSNELLSRNDLTDQSSVRVLNEPLVAKRLLARQTERAIAELKGQLLCPILRHRGLDVREPRPSPLLNALGPVAALLRERYWPQVSARVLEQVSWVGRTIHVHAGAGAEAQPLEEAIPILVPSVPQTQFLGNRAVTSPERRLHLGTSNPVSQAQIQALYRSNGGKWITFEQLVIILGRWYTPVDNNAPVGHCLFGAVACGIWGDSKGWETVRNGVLRYLTQRQSKGDADEVQRLTLKEDQTAIWGSRWGDAETLRAFSEILQRPIHVYVGGDRLPVKVRPDGRLNPQERIGDHFDAAPLELLYLYGAHYQYLQPNY